MIRSRNIALACAFLCAATTPALAQDTSLNANYGEVTLDVGFLPDPYYVELQSGGSIDASRLGGSCRGYISNAPDFKLYYNAGGSPLYLSVASRADTTLVVNLPDGSWWCDDDSGNDLNPLLQFDKPMSGRYDIWVGTYGGSELNNATLNISELYAE